MKIAGILATEIIKETSEKDAYEDMNLLQSKDEGKRKISISLAQ